MDASGSGGTINSGTRHRSAAGGSEREKGTKRTHGQDRLDQSIRAAPVRSSPLLFGCAGVRDPSTRARRMRHRRQKTKET